MPVRTFLLVTQLWVRILGGCFFLACSVSVLSGWRSQVVTQMKPTLWVCGDDSFAISAVIVLHLDLDQAALFTGYNHMEVEKGKLHGRIDVGLSVMAIKKKSKCIDLDAEENIYHLKIKSQELFDEWVCKLRHHRLYRQNEIAMLPPEKPLFSPHFPATSSPSFSETQAARKRASLAKQTSLHSPITFTSQAKVAAWLQYSDDMDRCSREDDSYLSDISDNISMDNFSNEVQNERLDSDCVENGVSQEKRRSLLPSPSPNTSNISLWNILRNNIGKDLSKVAMPVQLNEPLNTLQRLCEELEYSELLDRAAHTQDPFERMVYIATFAVSGYASSYYRAGGKPFNPVLGETYECDRPDRGFRFIAEQVSHHPPISACHAESKNFIFWQDVRWKNKFWGKSMEIVPVGTTHVVLPGLGDHYEWTKVTSCIHNILSGQRWIEHYGEICIKNTISDICQCKVTFIKAKYWNSSMNEVEGTIVDHKGKVIHKLFGKWHESIYCGSPPSATCIWRINSMPADYEQFYGFTKFAIELNELDPQTKPLLPRTDTRLRLDQRLLEEGNIEAAETQKQRIEQLQRDRRRVLEENNMTHQPRFFQKSKDDTWVSNNTYWNLRKDPGFSNLNCPVLW
ncbi:Oxysterol-binding protein-related protein 3 [Bagarius yarrelli]|uniref:Oxysterol-binding protein n=1 Tax=Bagarius yarrelli TaxID=175774 RepID=A0A556TPY2_BAGYA|nr:Oxysterol-binding protein-related protein 3 [Bagarius yarrelli]